jgi:hypothetical protein
MPLPQFNLPPIPTMRGPDGRLITVHDLPSKDNVGRWTRGKRELIVSAVNNRLLTLEQAFERYQLTSTEFDRWKNKELSLPKEKNPLEDSRHTRHASVLRTVAGATGLVEYDGLSVDFDNKKVLLEGVSVRLAPLHYRVVALLAEQVGHVLSGEQIVEVLYPDTHMRPGEKIIDTVICKVRKHFLEVTGKKYIKTVWGRGYMIPKPVTVAVK